MFLVEKHLDAQRCHKCETDEKVEELQNSSEGSVAEICSVKYRGAPQSPLETLRSTVKKYFQRLPVVTERLTADITDRFTGFLCVILKETQFLAETGLKGIYLTVAIAIDAVEGFLSIVDNKSCWLAPSL